MAQRKQVVKDRAALANLITKLEGTKYQAHVNAIRQAFKRLIELDVQATLEGKKSVLCMLRGEVRSRVEIRRKFLKRKLVRKKK